MTKEGGTPPAGEARLKVDEKTAGSSSLSGSVTPEPGGAIGTIRRKRRNRKKRRAAALVAGEQGGDGVVVEKRKFHKKKAAKAALRAQLEAEANAKRQETVKEEETKSEVKVEPKVAETEVKVEEKPQVKSEKPAETPKSAEFLKQTAPEPVNQKSKNKKGKGSEKPDEVKKEESIKSAPEPPKVVPPTKVEEKLVAPPAEVKKPESMVESPQIPESPKIPEENKPEVSTPVEPGAPFQEIKGRKDNKKNKKNSGPTQPTPPTENEREFKKEESIKHGISGTAIDTKNEPIKPPSEAIVASAQITTENPPLGATVLPENVKDSQKLSFTESLNKDLNDLAKEVPKIEQKPTENNLPKAPVEVPTQKVEEKKPSESPKQEQNKNQKKQNEPKLDTKKGQAPPSPQKGGNQAPPNTPITENFNNLEGPKGKSQPKPQNKSESDKSGVPPSTNAGKATSEVKESPKKVEEPQKQPFLEALNKNFDNFAKEVPKIEQKIETAVTAVTTAQVEVSAPKLDEKKPSEVPIIEQKNEVPKQEPQKNQKKPNEQKFDAKKGQAPPSSQKGGKTPPTTPTKENSNSLEGQKGKSQPRAKKISESEAPPSPKVQEASPKTEEKLEAPKPEVKEIKTEEPSKCEPEVKDKSQPKTQKKSESEAPPSPMVQETASKVEEKSAEPKIEASKPIEKLAEAVKKEPSKPEPEVKGKSQPRAQKKSESEAPPSPKVQESLPKAEEKLAAPKPVESKPVEKQAEPIKQEPSKPEPEVKDKSQTIVQTPSSPKVQESAPKVEEKPAAIKPAEPVKQEPSKPEPEVKKSEPIVIPKATEAVKSGETKKDQASSSPKKGGKTPPTTPVKENAPQKSEKTPPTTPIKENSNSFEVQKGKPQPKGQKTSESEKSEPPASPKVQESATKVEEKPVASKPEDNKTKTEQPPKPAEKLPEPEVKKSDPIPIPKPVEPIKTDEIKKDQASSSPQKGGKTPPVKENASQKGKQQGKQRNKSESEKSGPSASPKTQESVPAPPKEEETKPEIKEEPKVEATKPVEQPKAPVEAKVEPKDKPEVPKRSGKGNQAQKSAQEPSSPVIPPKQEEKAPIPIEPVKVEEKKDLPVAQSLEQPAKPEEPVKNEEKKDSSAPPVKEERPQPPKRANKEKNQSNSNEKKQSVEPIKTEPEVVPATPPKEASNLPEAQESSQPLPLKEEPSKSDPKSKKGKAPSPPKQVSNDPEPSKPDNEKEKYSNSLSSKDPPPPNLLPENAEILSVATVPTNELLPPVDAKSSSSSTRTSPGETELSLDLPDINNLQKIQELREKVAQAPPKPKEPESPTTPTFRKPYKRPEFPSSAPNAALVELSTTPDLPGSELDSSSLASSSTAPVASLTQELAATCTDTSSVDSARDPEFTIISSSSESAADQLSVPRASISSTGSKNADGSDSAPFANHLTTAGVESLRQKIPQSEVPQILSDTPASTTTTTAQPDSPKQLKDDANQATKCPNDSPERTPQEKIEPVDFQGEQLIDILEAPKMTTKAAAAVAPTPGKKPAVAPKPTVTPRSVAKPVEKKPTNGTNAKKPAPAAVKKPEVPPKTDQVKAKAAAAVATNKGAIAKTAVPPKTGVKVAQTASDSRAEPSQKVNKILDAFTELLKARAKSSTDSSSSANAIEPGAASTSISQPTQSQEAAPSDPAHPIKSPKPTPLNKSMPKSAAAAATPKSTKTEEIHKILRTAFGLKETPKKSSSPIDVSEFLTEEQMRIILSEEEEPAERENLAAKPSQLLQSGDILKSLAAPPLLKSAVQAGDEDFEDGVEDEEDEEEEYIEFKFTPRQVFMATICQQCKNILKATIPCPGCKMVFYCKPEHLSLDEPSHRGLCEEIQKLAAKRGGHVYDKATKLSYDEFRNLRMQTLHICETGLQRPMQPFEREILLFPRICASPSCREWNLDLLTVCKECRHVAYCEDRPHHLPETHKKWCKYYTLYYKMLLRQKLHGRIEPILPNCMLHKPCKLPGSIGDVFKMLYKNSTALKDDATHAIMTQIATIPLTALYSYQKTQFQTDETFVLHLIALKDECTFATLTQVATVPLTALYAFQKTNLPVPDTFTIHLIGAELQFEGDSLDKYESFLLHLMPEVNELRIVFVGSELNVENLPLEVISRIRPCRKCRQSCRAVKFDFKERTAYHDYAASPSFSRPDMICFFNPTLHRSAAAGYTGTDTWAPTIRAALDQQCPVLVTSYTEMESPLDMARVQIEGINYNFHVLQRPAPNPFASQRPERNFVSDELAPMIFKNFYYFVLAW